MSAPVDVLAVMNELAGKIWRQNDSDPILVLADEARAAVAELIEALKEAHYGGLLVGEDCAWALAKLQREGVYKPRCSDGQPSRADAGRDEDYIKKVRQQTAAALARVKGVAV